MIEYGNHHQPGGLRATVIGGHVYRGRALPPVRVATTLTGRLGHYLLGFGQDPAGELYALTTDQTGRTGSTGKLFKLVRPSG